MGKQIDRLFCERLKKRYEVTFKEFRDLAEVKTTVNKLENDFLQKVYSSLNEVREKTKDISKKFAVENELKRIHDKFNKEACPVESIKLQCLEVQLNAIEDELNQKGVAVNIDDGEPTFEEMQEKKE